MSEHTEQAALLDRVRLYTPRCPALGLLYAVPNGGHRTAATAARLRAEGVLRGIPDLHLPVARRDFHGLWIEMKVKGGRVSPHQQDYIDRLRQEGHKVAICFSQEAAWETLCWYLDIDADSAWPLVRAGEVAA